MGTRQTLDVLQSYASLLSGLGDPSGAAAVRALSKALSVAEDKTIKSTVAKVAKLWAAMPHAAVAPAGLARHLATLKHLLAAGGAKATSTDVNLLAELVDNRVATEPSAFEHALREAISAAPIKAAKRKSAKRGALSEAEVRHWADRLTAVSADRSSFEVELSTLQAIPGLSSAEIRAVAERYLGHEVSGGKLKILKTMRSRQQQDAIEASRQGRLSHIAV